ncbi:RagB/SusD family nutrient uptake outer membrane protein [Gracilimonas halophila]|uniref:RagB/SusD family nutrient uptake outer membrane protein n=1 Tax=Gracilimonas halophila TaxID=1834464 RepID=A0ABW5JGJ3_9BACT
MKNLIKLTFFAGLLMITHQGCDSILSGTEPSTAISQEVALNSPEAVRGLRARMYGRLHAAPDMSTTWLLGPSALADNTDIGSGTRFESLNNNERRAGLGTGAWNNLYDLINDANTLIEGIPDGVITEANRTKFMGEAYFMRALALHHLVRIFGYEPGMAPTQGEAANFDLGVIIRTQPTLTLSDVGEEPRSTVTQVYDQILDDIDSALTALNQESDSGPFYVTPAAAYALLARVQLYQRNYAEADAAAQDAIDNSGARLATTAEVAGLFDETQTNPEAIFTVDVDPTTESGGVNNSLAVYTSMYWFGQIPTDDLINLYEAGDARLDAWYAPCFNDVNDSPENICSNVNADNLELHKYAAEQGSYADDYVHFRFSEMLLIQAEARLDTDGIPQAINRLNDLRAERNASTLLAINYTTEEEVLDEILDERRRELSAEGHRFFDLKRLGRDLRKVDFDQGTGTTTVSFLPYESYVYLDDIPDSEVQLNPNLVQNPFFD